MGTIVRGSGHFVPERVVTNEELSPLIGTTPEWIEERTGIRARHYISAGESNASLAEEASRRALEDAQWAPEDLDAIILCTLSSDAVFPGNGVYLAARLGLQRTPAMDVRNQCSGFLYGLSVADAWLAVGRYRRVLLVGSEVHSTSLDFSPASRNVTALFGDGAGAVALEWDDNEPGLRDIRLGADGNGAESLWCEVPSARLHPSTSAELLAQGRQFPQMQGRAVFRRAVETLERELLAVMGEVDELAALDEVLFVPHQANKRISEMVSDRVGLTEAQTVSTIEYYANTTAASLPSALDVARRDGRAHPGRVVLMAAFGSGFTWGTAVWVM
jgi:3-oxoacyl-[acyl-carrier-protein] synthase-3